MEYKPTASSAIEFSQANRLEEWIHMFLCGEGNNKPFSDGLKLLPRRYHAPVMASLAAFSRMCGPEEHMKWRVNESQFLLRVNAIAERFKKGDWDMPPLIIRKDADGYELNDGNHRYEALKSLGTSEYWVILWEADI